MAWLGLANYSWQLAIGGTASRNFSGSFSLFQREFLAVVRRFDCCQLPSRQVAPAGRKGSRTEGVQLCGG